MGIGNSTAAAPIFDLHTIRGDAGEGRQGDVARGLRSGTGRLRRGGIAAESRATKHQGGQENSGHETVLPFRFHTLSIAKRTDDEFLFRSDGSPRIEAGPDDPPRRILTRFAGTARPPGVC